MLWALHGLLHLHAHLQERLLAVSQAVGSSRPFEPSKLEFSQAHLHLLLLEHPALHLVVHLQAHLLLEHPALHLDLVVHTTLHLLLEHHALHLVVHLVEHQTMVLLLEHPLHLLLEHPATHIPAVDPALHLLRLHTVGEPSSLSQEHLLGCTQLVAAALACIARARLGAEAPLALLVVAWARQGRGEGEATLGPAKAAEPEEAALVAPSSFYGLPKVGKKHKGESSYE